MTIRPLGAADIDGLFDAEGIALVYRHFGYTTVAQGLEGLLRRPSH